MTRGTYAITILVSVETSITERETLDRYVDNLIKLYVDGGPMRLLTEPAVTSLYDPIEVPA